VVASKTFPTGRKRNDSTNPVVNRVCGEWVVTNQRLSTICYNCPESGKEDLLVIVPYPAEEFNQVLLKKVFFRHLFASDLEEIIFTKIDINGIPIKNLTRQ